MFGITISSHIFCEVIIFFSFHYFSMAGCLILCRITNAVKESGGLKERLFHAAYNAKRQAIINGKNSMKLIEIKCLP